MDHESIRKQMGDWYHAYSNDIYRYVFFMVSNHEQAKDIMQDTFIRAYTNFDSFKGGNDKGWLFTIARNLTIDYIRRNRPLTLNSDLMVSIKSHDISPEQTVLLIETEKELYLALSNIKSAYRDVIILRKIKEFSIQESAQILGWNESKVKTTLFRGMKALKKRLEMEGYKREAI